MSKLERQALRIIRKMEGANLSEVVSKIARNYGIRTEDAAKAVYLLWKKGEIELIDKKPKLKTINYVFSIWSAWFWILTGLLVSTIFIVFYITTPPLVYLRYILGSLYVLYIPGYTLIEALYPRVEDLEPLERLALSIGLSLAVVPLIGLILNYTPWGIRLAPVTISLAIFSEIMAVISLIRKHSYYKLSYLRI